MKFPLIVSLGFVLLSCSSKQDRDFSGTYTCIADNGSELTLALYKDSTYAHTSLMNTKGLGFDGYPEKGTIQLNGKWKVEKDTLILNQENISILGETSKSSQILKFYIVEFDQNKLVLKDQNQVIRDYTRKN